MVEIAEIKPSRWWVCFRSRPKDDPAFWYHLFTRRGFEHCFAFCEWSENVVLLVNPKRHEIGFEMIGMNAWQVIEQIRRESPDPTIVVYEPKSSPYNPPSRGWLITCASVIGYMLGIDTRAVTPFGLHRALMAQGARAVWEP